MADEFSARTGGKRPYDWQIDAAECVLLGVNGIFIAWTGAGKTIPFMLPCLLPQGSDKVTVVISPLKVLQQEHVCVTFFLMNSFTH